MRYMDDISDNRVRPTPVNPQIVSHSPYDHCYTDSDHIGSSWNAAGGQQNAH